MTRRLRIASLLLSVLLLTCILSSCDWIDTIKLHFSSAATEAPRGIPENNDSEYVALSTDEYVYSSYYQPIEPCHSYQLLSSGQKALYDQLLDNVSEVYPDPDSDEKLYKTRQVIVDDYLLSSGDIRVASKALYDDHPDIFWLSSTIYQLKDDNSGYTAVQMRSIYSPDEILKMQKEIYAEVNRFYAGVPKGLSEYEREKYVHNYIIDSCVYDKKAAETNDSEDRIAEAYTIYGTLVENKSVCEGYARTMQLLLCGLGVDCVGVTGMGYDGDGDSELHLWNAVELDGDWYYVDPTWDDQSSELNRYYYFNLDEKTMGVDHTKSRLLSDLSEDEINGDETFSSVAMNIFVPECNSTDYQYYIYECPHLENYDGYEVIDGLYYAAIDREEAITIYIDPDKLDYDEALEVLFTEQPQYFFDYVQAANDRLFEVEIDNSNLSYYNYERLSIVTVLLSYY